MSQEKPPQDPQDPRRKSEEIIQLSEVRSERDRKLITEFFSGQEHTIPTNGIDLLTPEGKAFLEKVLAQREKLVDIRNLTNEDPKK